MTDKTLLILAAGIGRRYGGLKQMDPMGPSGEFIIDYSIHDAIHHAGFNRIIFLISRDIEDDFKAMIGNRIEKKIKVEYVYQDDAASFSSETGNFTAELPANRAKPWGTGHAILACADIINEPFAVINSDDFYGRESFQFLSSFLEQSGDKPNVLCMVGFILKNTLSEYGSVARGICALNADNTLKHVVETVNIRKDKDAILFGLDGYHNKKARLNGEEIVSMNMWGLKPSLFKYLADEFRVFIDKYHNCPNAEFYIPSVIDKWVLQEKGVVNVLKTRSSWFGITYAEDRIGAIRNIKELIDTGIYPDNLVSR